MGRNKMLVKVHGMPLIRRAALHALRACRRLIVVTGNESEAVAAAVDDLQRVQIIFNEHFHDGMFGSIQAGMAGVESDWFFVVPGDLPDLDTSIFEHVAGAVDDWGAAADGSRVPSGGDTPNPGMEAGRVRAIVPFYHDTRGHPVLIHRSLIPELLDQPRDAGPMRRLIARYPVRRVRVDRREIVGDIDVPTDLSRHLKTTKSG